MSDELDNDPPPPSRAARWTALLVVFTLLGAGVYTLYRSHAQTDERSAQNSAEQSQTPTVPSPSAQQGASSTRTSGAWPTRPAACGGDAALPQVSAPALSEKTRLRLLVGGSGLRVVDVDSGRVSRVPDAGQSVTPLVTDLIPTDDGYYALARRCTDSPAAAGAVLRVDAGLASARSVPARRFDIIITSGDSSWGYRYPADEKAPLLLYPLGRGSTLQMPPGFTPFAVTAGHFLGAISPPQPATTTEIPTVASVDRNSPKRLTRLVPGLFMVGTDDFVLSAGACSAEEKCILTRTSLHGKPARHFTLPSARSPVSAATLSPDGRRVAFLLSRAEPDPRFEADHPWGPSDVAVLDLNTGHLTILDGLELAPKSSVGLAFSHDNRWLLLGLTEGDAARLLVWRDGWPRPQTSSARLPGAVLYMVPLVDASGSASPARR